MIRTVTLVLALALAACTEVQHQSENRALDLTLNAYANAIRWGDIQQMLPFVEPDTPTVKLSMFPAKVPPVPRLGPRPKTTLAAGYEAVTCAHDALHANGAQLKTPLPTFCDEYQTPSDGFIVSHVCQVEFTTEPLFGTNANVVYPLTPVT